MRLTRVYVDCAARAGQALTLEGSAGNHIVRVLRLRTGDSLTLFDGRGGEFSANIQEIRRDTVLVKVLEHQALERESACPLTLAQGISRGERMDWVVQKATELGVARIVPLFTERSVVQLDEKQAVRKVQHWRSIAVAACEQSGRNRIPEIAPPLAVFEFLQAGKAHGAAAAGRAGTGFLLSPRAARRIGDIDTVAGGATVLIGPEGGLAEIEQEAAIQSGFTAVRMGPRVLRTETAAVCALTLLQQKFGDL
jgi:16S rRNA (uracil1498-N3)-methyltransferase